MKGILKKASAVCAVVACSVSLTAAGSTMVLAAEADETIQAQVVTIAEGLTTTIIPLTDAEIENYLNSGDEFTIQAMESWTGSKEELGEFEELGTAEVDFTDNQYTVVVPAEFDEADAEFEYVFDNKGTPETLAVNVQYPLSVSLTRAGLNTLMGMGVVFAVLIFLSFVIYLLKFIPGLLEGKKEEDETEENTPVPVPAPAAPAVQAVSADQELVAVITAAIAAAEGKTSTDGYVVRSIRKINRKKR